MRVLLYLYVMMYVCVYVCMSKNECCGRVAGGSEREGAGRQSSAVAEQSSTANPSAERRQGRDD